MEYTSTRDRAVRVPAARAIAQGISADGGLFVPDHIPALFPDDLKRLCSLDYVGRAAEVLGLYLTDFSPAQIVSCVRGAYLGRFDADKPAPLHPLADGVDMLELWHGPTCAFKDLALQLLPRLLTAAVEKTGDGCKTVILVATSGDTGKAALEGFCDVENTEIIVFYPSEGVSRMQKLQMDTQRGGNVHVCAIAGNFDDAQTSVKQMFTDPQLTALLRANGMQFSSANSINWGRLVPQIVYYVSAYCDLVTRGADLQNGFHVVVPTGNFGNILAAYYAKRMGVPISKLICASNANNVLTDFLQTGVYDRNRPFYTTTSPSMDILVSSNLERLLFALCGENDRKVADWQAQLAATGRFTVDDAVKDKLAALFAAGSCDDAATAAAIRGVYEKTGYLCDTHTAVAAAVYGAYRARTGDATPAVIVSTASPYKFPASVLEALGEIAPADPFDALDRLSERTGTPIPAPLSDLRQRKPCFSGCCEKTQLRAAVLQSLGLSE